MPTDLQAVVKQAAEALEKTGNARAVFGDPVKLDTRTIVPVAAVLTNLGIGGGQATILGIGGGGGLNLRVVPLGYVHETDEGIAFTRIEIPELDKLLEAEEQRGRRGGDGKRKGLTDQLRSRIGR